MKCITLILTITLINISCTQPNTNKATQEHNSTITEQYDESNPIRKLPPLHQAIIANDTIRVKKLIQIGADVNQLDGLMGNAPLHVAAQAHNPRMIELLLANGAFVNLHAPRSGQTPLMIAVWYAKPQNIKALLKAEDINLYASSPYGGATAMDMIGGWDKDLDENEIKRNTEIRTILENYEADLQQRMAAQKIYQTVIDAELTEDEKTEKVKQLIAFGEEVNTISPVMGTGNDRHSPLLVAARNNYPKIVKMLLDAKAFQGQRGYIMNAIPFHKGGYMGNVEVLQYLVADTHAKEFIDDQGPNNGYTPLHDAIWHGNTEAAKVLIEAGARLDLRNYENQTPLDLAKYYGYDEIVNLIETEN